MNYSEDHIALAAEYALGTLDADERALVETMMIVDQGFRDVVSAWDRKLGPLQQMVDPVEPPAHLWDKIQAAVRLAAAEAAAAAVKPDDATPVAATPEPGGIPIEDKPVAETGSDVAPVVASTTESTPPLADEPAAPSPSNVVSLQERRRGGGIYSTLMTAVAASLAGVIALQAYRPDLLPEKLRVKPQVRVVEVAAPAPALPAQFVAILQQNAAAPAFILTVDTATKNYTVRKLGAPSEPGKSYELWLVSDKFPQPRSLGVIGNSDFTIRPTLAGYDQDTISKSTYAVTIEPPGGSPTGAATGPIVYTGKLVESVPTLPASRR